MGGVRYPRGPVTAEVHIPVDSPEVQKRYEDRLQRRTEALKQLHLAESRKRAEAQECISRLQTEKSALEAELARVRAAAVGVMNPQSAAPDLAKAALLAELNAQLKSALAEAERARGESAALEEQYAKLRGEMEALKISKPAEPEIVRVPTIPWDTVASLSVLGATLGSIAIYLLWRFA
jgi:predicted nuclease with TOPRIM domain